MANWQMQQQDWPWSRHELLRVAPAAWSRALAARPDLAEVPYLADWARNGWPVIVRRPDCGARDGLVPIGVPLPPAAGKLRVGLMIPPEAVLERMSPPCLWSARHAAGAAWRHTIHDLFMLGMRHAAMPTAIGSLFWQYRTGLRYLSPQSDLDVLWQARSSYGIRSLLAGIEEIERAGGIRIDGEVVFRDGSAVNWRELYLALDRGRTPDVVVKSMHGARLVGLFDLPIWSAA